LLNDRVQTSSSTHLKQLVKELHVFKKLPAKTYVFKLPKDMHQYEISFDGVGLPSICSILIDGDEKLTQLYTSVLLKFNELFFIIVYLICFNN